MPTFFQPRYLSIKWVDFLAEGAKNFFDQETVICWKLFPIWRGNKFERFLKKEVFWSFLPLTQQKSSPLLSSSKRFILATCLRNSTPLYFFGKFLLSTLSFIQKALLQKDIQHNIVFITTAILSKTFKIEIKTLGVVFQKEKFGKEGRLFPNLICSNKVSQFLCWRRQIFLETRIAIKRMKTTLAEICAKWRGN